MAVRVAAPVALGAAQGDGVGVSVLPPLTRAVAGRVIAGCERAEAVAGGHRRRASAGGVLMAGARGVAQRLLHNFELVGADAPACILSWRGFRRREQIVIATNSTVQHVQSELRTFASNQACGSFDHN